MLKRAQRIGRARRCDRCGEMIERGQPYMAEMMVRRLIFQSGQIIFRRMVARRFHADCLPYYEPIRGGEG
jgi:hypothetical protein